MAYRSSQSCKAQPLGSVHHNTSFWHVGVHAFLGGSHRRGNVDDHDMLCRVLRVSARGEPLIFLPHDGMGPLQSKARPRQRTKRPGP